MPKPKRKRTAEMLRKDLERTRGRWIAEAVDADQKTEREGSSFLAYVDHNGHYADFHALRKKFITDLSRTGVSPKTVQTLARHSDINLTMNTYTMLGVHDQVAGVEALPAIPVGRNNRREAVSLRATGTDDKSADRPSDLVPILVPISSHQNRTSLHQIALKRGRMRADHRGQRKPKKRRRKRGFLHSVASNCIGFQQYRRGDSNPHSELPELDFESSARFT